MLLAGPTEQVASASSYLELTALPSVFPLLLQNDLDRMEQLVLVRMGLLCDLLLVPKHSVAMLADPRYAARTRDLPLWILGILAAVPLASTRQLLQFSAGTAWLVSLAQPQRGTKSLTTADNQLKPARRYRRFKRAADYSRGASYANTMSAVLKNCFVSVQVKLVPKCVQIVRRKT